MNRQIDFVGNTAPRLVAVCAAFVISQSGARAQFSSGSDGSDGALAVSEDTEIALPADGILNYTSVTIDEGATVTFAKNEMNTPVYLLSTGPVLINGFLDVSGGAATQVNGGVGGPGGFQGGQPGFNELAPGAGLGPGGGKGGAPERVGAGSGAYLNRGTQNQSANTGEPYGSPILIPLVGGSGGGGTIGSPGFGGGGGGGAILVSSDVEVEVGASGGILARGGNDGDSDIFGNDPHHHGSGGAIRLVAPLVKGTGRLETRGGNPDDREGRSGDGRIRIDAVERREMNFDYQPIRSVSVGVLMAVFPSPLPQLHVIEVAGQAIPEGTVPPTTFVLPTGSPAEQTVTVQARNFQGVVDVVVRLIPENGEPADFTGQIDMATGNPATTDITVTFPLNIGVSVQAWTAESEL